MLRTFLRWVDRFFAWPAMPGAVVDESWASTARLNGMYADFGRLTHAEWLAKWQPNGPQP